jgi:hypothetical protein
METLGTPGTLGRKHGKLLSQKNVGTNISRGFNVIVGFRKCPDVYFWIMLQQYFVWLPRSRVGSDVGDGVGAAETRTAPPAAYFPAATLRREEAMVFAFEKHFACRKTIGSARIRGGLLKLKAAVENRGIARIITPMIVAAIQLHRGMPWPA